MKQDEFGYRIRQALNDGAEALDYKTLLRLERARQAALAHHRIGREAPVWTPVLQPAGPAARIGDDDLDGAWGWLRRMGLVLPIAVLIVGFVGIYQWHHARSISDRAALDFAVLLDEAPLDAYADQGFGLLLQDSQRLQRL